MGFPRVFFSNYSAFMIYLSYIIYENDFLYVLCTSVCMYVCMYVRYIQYS